MKRPSISFSTDAILGFLLAHGEKIGVAVVGVLACFLVLQGVGAARTKTAGRNQLPNAIEEQAGRAAANVQAAKQPPAEEVRRSGMLKSIEPWRAPDVQPPPQIAMLDRPLFEEKSKRSKPEVFPIEELHAVAGIAFMPERPADAGRAQNPADVDAPGAGDRPEGGSKRRLKDRGQPGQAGQPQALPGFSEFGPGMMPPEMIPGLGMPAAVRGRLVPYCVVTGLIPVARQMAEYDGRFGNAGLRDPQRDTPLWSDYQVERTVVGPGGREEWKPIDLRQFYADAARQWAGVQQDQLPPGFMFMLSGEQNPGAAFGYCGPLPLLGGDPWGFEAWHPWFVKEYRKILDEQARAAAEQAEQAATILPGQQPGAAPGFGPPAGEFGPPGAPGFGPGEMGMPPGMMGDPSGRPAVGPEYRLFRFVDTTVESGKTYRYRVRLSLWNPNRELEPRYLADATLARASKLASAPSNVTPPVVVPGTGSLLVRPLRKADTKRFKPGMLEVLVLDKSRDTGNYALRSVVTEPGGIANVDKKLNKPGDTRSRGEDTFTDAVLVDVRGSQSDRTETRAGKKSPPPEPLDMLFLGRDGGFTVATTAESQPKVDRYLGTLPEADDAKGSRDRPAAAPESPFNSPFGR